MKRSSALLCLLLMVGGVVALVLAHPDQTPVVAPQPEPKRPAVPVPDDGPVASDWPIPPYSESEYLNTGPDAKYIGTAACAKCHPKKYDSYALTAHSKALCEIDLADEPPDGTFEHKLSGRTYRVYRKDGQLRHEEVMRTAEGKEIGRVDLPVRYRVGSGHFTRTYLVEVDEFLVESPITWYKSKNRWDMSPGFDVPRPAGFERPAQIGCVVCHAGRVERRSEGDHRLTLHERAIGCESCHGPGSLHRDRDHTQKRPAGETDRTIVTPSKLSRPLLESVCAACHLAGSAGVIVRGREVTDFRPGLPLSDVAVHYRADRGDQMTVVGHVEQLRLSKCYQKNETLSCITCHDPHAPAKPADPVAFYRQKCLDCHNTKDAKACKKPPEKRLEVSPADNCASCHMPRGDTDIPHVAFTHHRIGLHADRPKVKPKRTPGVVPDLVPLDENPHLSALDRSRNLGLAYLELIPDPDLARECGERAREYLDAAYRGGVRDASTVYALADIYKNQNPPRAAALAREVLTLRNVPPTSRTVSCEILAVHARATRNLADAEAYMLEGVRYGRFADDWRLLGLIYLDENKLDKSLAAFEQSLAIRPFRVATHREIARCYDRLGDSARARDHIEKANWLIDHNQD